MTPGLSTFDFLLGTWLLRRTVDDHLGGVRLRFDGTAVVTAEAGKGVRRARYVETGVVVSPSHSGPARRELRFDERPDGAVDVRFADGRPFFDLDLRDGVCVAEHPCAPDRYALRFSVVGPGTIEERWTVRGPAKRYDAVSVWSRAPRPGTRAGLDRQR